ncbi:MAG: hypothetical protein ABIW76_02780 [Fibrobacteria bacterium]
MSVLGIGSVSAQLERYIPTRNTGLWSADTLYIGASFTRTSLDPVTVSLKGNEAGWTGTLYFIDPKTGIEDRLFTNHDPVNTNLILSSRHDIPLGDTVYFVYKVDTKDPAGRYPSENSRKPKYTGPNIAGQSRYVSEASSVQFGHRWSVAGRVNDSIVEFGFEDNVEPASSDMDFDDIVFRTSLSLVNDEVPARLYFADKTGKTLAAGAQYSPANDSIYLTYSDDYGRGTTVKEITLTVKNRKGAALPDSETFTMVQGAPNGPIGTWTVAIPLHEAPGIPNDKKLQVYYIGEVTANVKTHNRFGLPDGNSVSATLTVEYPDTPETVKIISCPDSAQDITRTTTCVNIRLNDQSFTRNQDTVWAELKCSGSGDVIAKVRLIELPAGGYRSEDIVKNETAPPNPADQAISCLTSDAIIATYVDEVYNNRVTDQKNWNGGAAEGLNFSALNDAASQITTIKDGDADSFTVVVKGPSATVGVRDTILVTLASPQNEMEIVKAVETDVNSNLFTVNVSFDFLTTPPTRGNGIVEGYLDALQAITNVVVTGTATVNGKPYTATLTMLPALNLVRKAYIKDMNGDGRGDQIYIVFSRPLEAAPVSISPVYWNSVDEAHLNKGIPVITIVPGAPNTIVADFTASQFPAGATAIAAGQRPFATLPSDGVFGAQKPAIADSMGPIIISAIIKPFNSQSVTPGSTTLNVDTVIVKLSELIKTQSDWQELIRFSKTINGACTDYAHAAPVVPYTQPQDSGNGTFTLLVANGTAPSPLAGDCVYLNVNGTYTDLAGNLPPIHGEKLIGNKPSREIELFRGYPPVAGMNASYTGFVVVNNDPQSDQGSEYSKRNGPRYETVWVPPADFPPGFVPGVSVYVPIVPALGADVTPNQDKGRVGPMPLNISTVQVISTGEYIAEVSIFDNLGNFVKTFRQAFGYLGELNNQQRAAKRGLVSYLVWDLKNAKGQKAGQGVYVWKVIFRFKNGKQEIRYTRTGVMRNPATSQLP